ncbi:MAG: putative ABC transporter ATP-binding protein YxlF [Firmicutes bacterium]|nr:putative ABC transporter ATP-binding protein YxlF [Bacillota bacterium]
MGEGMAVRVDCHRLAKRYPSRQLFANLSFTIAPNSIFVVTGHNGTGKTTLLKLVAGLVPPSEGTVQIHCQERTLAPGEVRQTLGMVSPDLALYDALSGLENLEFFAAVRGIAAPTQQFAGLLEQVGLKKRSHDLVSTYSAGMKQRLKYAHALLHEPQILILDEPTSNLDSQGAQMVCDIMRRQRERGIVIFATNDLREVALADAVLVLD